MGCCKIKGLRFYVNPVERFDRRFAGSQVQSDRIVLRRGRAIQRTLPDDADPDPVMAP